MGEKIRNKRRARWFSLAALFLEDAWLIVLHGQDSGWKELPAWPRVGRGCSSLGGLEGAHWEAAACHSSKAVQLLYLMFSL